MRDHVSHVLEVLGFHVFMWTFWLDLGIYLGGDAWYLGKFHPELEIVFPVCGFGILLAFLAQFLKDHPFRVPKLGALWILVFMGISTILANFSHRPQVSIYFLVIWTIGFFVMASPRTFCLDRADKQYTLLGSLLLGFGILVTTPQTVLSPFLLVVGILWLLISMHQEKVIPFRYELSYLLFGFLFLLQSPLFLGLGLFLWITSNVWLGKRKRMTSSIKWALGCVVGCVCFGFSVYLYGIPTPTLGNISSIFNWNAFFTGVGEGQYLHTFVDEGTLVLDPGKWQFPSSGFVLVLIERGLIGFLLFCTWLAIPRTLKESDPVQIFLVAICCLVTSLGLTVESGILLLNVILFSHPNKALESPEVIPPLSWDASQITASEKRK